ncbi:MAG TPA: hypothetical protein VGB89_11160 [Bacteroidota bacterium]
MKQRKGIGSVDARPLRTIFLACLFHPRRESAGLCFFHGCKKTLGSSHIVIGEFQFTLESSKSLMFSDFLLFHRGKEGNIPGNSPFFIGTTP